MTEDIRWIQRFSNFEKAFSQLKEFIEKGEFVLLFFSRNFK